MIQVCDKSIQKHQDSINFFNTLSPLIVTKCIKYSGQIDDIVIMPAQNKNLKYENCSVAAALSVSTDYWVVKFIYGNPNYILLGNYDLRRYKSFTFSVTNDSKSMYRDDFGKAEIILSKDRECNEAIARTIPKEGVGWFEPYTQSIELKSDYCGPVYLSFRFYHLKDAKREDGLLIGNMRFNLYNNMESEFINISSEYRLLYVGEGNAELICESRCDQLNKGSIVIFYPYENEKMIVRQHGGSEIYCVYFYGKNVIKILSHLGLTRQRVICAGDEVIFKYYFDNILNEFNEKGSFFYGLANVYFYQLLLMVARNASPGNYESSNRYIEVDRAVHIFNTLYSEPITISGIAKKLCISECWFSRIFTKQTGVSPKKYLILVRTEKAKELLKSTTKPIGEISLLVGYEDQLYFSKCFKKITGMSPTEYRNANAGIHSEPEVAD